MAEQKGGYMRYFIGLSCEEYTYYSNISFCHNDLFLLEDTLVNFCDYSRNECNTEMVYPDADESNPQYWYDTINSVCEKATLYDTILFYFAGHGMNADDDVYFLLPNSIAGREQDTALSLKKLNQCLKKAKCSSFSIIDACHSGTDARDGVNLGFSPQINDKSWATLAACSENESSHPDSVLEQGIFTYCIAEAIKGWEKEKIITIEELKIVVCEKIEELCKKNGVTQHPTLNGSVVGVQDFAIRNKKISQYEVVVQDKKEDGMENEIIVADKNSAPVLWTASNGIIMPKKTEIREILALSVQLRTKEVATIYALYNGESYEVASETIWERAIRVLRERVLSLGLEFVGEMVGLDNMDYVRELPAFEVINLAAELGFINSTGKMRLSQANELVQHYRGRDIEDEMPQNESDTVIRACIQYILGYESSEISIEFGDFRNSLKHDLFEKQSQKMEMLINSPYFYKKTTVRTLINLIASTEGAEYETVSSNFSSIIEVVWESLTSDDRYFIGVTYSKYANKGELKYILTFKQALEKVHGFDYVPENLRSLSFIQAAKNIKKVHYEFNNFYKEPDAVKTLERLGNQIPKPAIKESISATLMVLLGNFYGSSNGAEDTAYKILDKLDKASWEYYMNECFPYDEDVLAKIAAGDRRTQVWCRIVKKYNLSDVEISDIKLQDLIKASSNDDKNNAKVLANNVLRTYMQR